MRRPQRLEDKLLLADTKDLIEHLPEDVRPKALPIYFPRIANEMCRRWTDTESLKEYFLSLLTDGRSGRRGFPPLVHNEILALAAYIGKRLDHSYDTRWSD